MTYEEVIEKIRSTTKVSVVSVKDIQHGKSITLSNGSIINCFNTGKHNVQGRNTDETKAILGETAKLGNRKYLLFTVMMILHVHSLKHCFAAGILSRLFLISRLQGDKP